MQLKILNTLMYDNINYSKILFRKNNDIKIDLEFFHIITFANIQTARFFRVFLENLNCPKNNHKTKRRILTIRWRKKRISRSYVLALLSPCAVMYLRSYV